MPAETMVGVVFVLAVFGFFMAMLAYADFTENRAMSGHPANSESKAREHEAFALGRSPHSACR